MRGLIQPGAEVSERDRRRAIEAREAIFALLLANGGAPLDPAAPATPNDLAAATALGLRFEGDGSARLEPKGRGVDAALGRILGLVFTACVAAVTQDPPNGACLPRPPWHDVQHIVALGRPHPGRDARASCGGPQPT